MSGKLQKTWDKLRAHDDWDKKWQERKAAPDAILKMVEGVKLCSGNYKQIVDSLKKLYVGEKNVLVAVAAIRATAALAESLGKDFAPYARKSAVALIDKSADKKQAARAPAWRRTRTPHSTARSCR